VSAGPVRPRHRDEEVRQRIPADYAGVMITDRAAGHDAAQLSGVKRQKCLCHVPQSLSGAFEGKRGKARWFASKLEGLLKRALALRHERRGGATMRDRCSGFWTIPRSSRQTTGPSGRCVRR